MTDKDDKTGTMPGRDDATALHLDLTIRMGNGRKYEVATVTVFPAPVPGGVAFAVNATTDPDTVGVTSAACQALLATIDPDGTLRGEAKPVNMAD